MTRRAEAARVAPDYFRWVVAGAIAFAFLSPLAAAWSTAPDLGHGWLTPVFLAYLWWERWTELPAARPAPSGLGWWTAGFATLALALLPVRLLLAPYPFWPTAVAIFVGAIATATLTLAWLLAGRPGIRWFGWPLLLLLGAIPWPSAVETLLILPLREQMAQLAAEISNLLGRPALAAGTSIQLGSGWVGIDEACGGIRSLQACVLIGLFFGEWFRLALPQRGWLVLAAATAAIMGNFARVLFLAFRPSAEAITQAHDLAGWTALLVSMFATGLLAWFWAGRRLPLAPTLSQSPAALAPRSRVWEVAAVFAAVLLVNEAATRAWFSLRQPASNLHAQWTASFPTGLQTYQPEKLSDIAREMLRPDFFASGRWRTSSDDTVAAYYIEWRQGQIARAIPFLHNPTVCLPMSGCELVDSQPTIDLPLGGLTIPFQTYRFRRLDREMLVAFTVWDPTTQAPLKQSDGDGRWHSWLGHRFSDVIAGKQHQPAQMLAIAIPWTDDADREMRWLLGKIVTPVADEKKIQ